MVHEILRYQIVAVVHGAQAVDGTLGSTPGLAGSAALLGPRLCAFGRG